MSDPSCLFLRSASDNIADAGCGRLRRPPTQPAMNGRSWRRERFESKKAEPGNEVIRPVRHPPGRYLKFEP